MPDQLDFKLAEPPQIISELPAPMAFVNDKGKKLIQFSGVPKKPKTKTIGKQKPKPVVAKKIEKVLEIKEKPEWNSKVETIGLFDPKLSKKIPIEIKHAIKKENFNNIKRPEVFNDIQEIDFYKNNKPKQIKSQGNKEKIDENLEIKFIADQEELVKKLEKQLENEKIARKRLDEQFSEKLKEIEKMGKKGKSVQFIGNSYGKVKDSEKNQKNFQSAKPVQNYVLEEKTRPVSTEGSKHDIKGGYIHEPPTHDISPMVLKAQKPVKPDKKPPSIQKPGIKHLGSGKTPENPKIPENQKNSENIQNLEFKELNIQPYLSAKNPVKFEVFDIAKSDPMLTTLNAAITKYKTAEKYSGHSGVGLISKISSKYIAYYANELTDMMLNDFLEDCVVDLQKVEEKKAKTMSSEFQKEAEKNFEIIVKDFYEETEKLQSKYVGKPKFIKKNENSYDETLIIIEDKKRD